jgi:hypothetical protein
MSTKVKKLILDEMLGEADSFDSTGGDLESYLRGLVDGVSIAQGRRWNDVLSELLEFARKEGVYEDVVRELEAIFDGE